MLRAMGIYTQDELTEEKGLKKFKFAQKDKGLFFQDNQLENIDTILLKSSFYSTMEANKVYLDVFNNEYQYLYRSSTTHAVFAIISKTQLDPTEKAFLFKNMEHILIRPDRVKITLDDIVVNPLNFTGRDLLIGRVQDGMQDVIAIMQKNIDMVIARGERLEDLKMKAIKLDEDATRVEIKAKKLNACCGW